LKSDPPAVCLLSSWDFVCLLSSWDYRRELQALVLFLPFQVILQVGSYAFGTRPGLTLTLTMTLLLAPP
jgi:hypothetical protein